MFFDSYSSVDQYCHSIHTCLRVELKSGEELVHSAWQGEYDIERMLLGLASS